MEPGHRKHGACAPDRRRPRESVAYVTIGKAWDGAIVGRDLSVLTACSIGEFDGASGRGSGPSV